MIIVKTGKLTQHLTFTINSTRFFCLKSGLICDVCERFQLLMRYFQFFLINKYKQKILIGFRREQKVPMCSFSIPRGKDHFKMFRYISEQFQTSPVLYLFLKVKFAGCSRWIWYKFYHNPDELNYCGCMLKSFKVLNFKF